MLAMDGVIDLAEWRSRRDALEEDPDEGARFASELARLERAVDRVYEVVGAGTEAHRRLVPSVETELLAILGELTIDLVGDAAVRAEKLAARLAAQKGFSRSGGQ
jgi:hypothetical protein